MGLLDRFFEKQLDKAKADITKTVTGELVTHVESQISKAQNPTDPFATGIATQGVKRYQFTQEMINGGIQRRKKPGSNVTFETMRAFSVTHEISRACINLRKRQINGLEWGIVASDPDDTKNYGKDIDAVKLFLKNIGGRGIGYRRFVDKFIEDLLVLDAVTIEKQRARNGGLVNLIPIDGATIRIRVDENGATPEPPETAYVQVIRGETTAEFTDDELIYEMMNPRNDTPYGLSPLESLMIIVTSSLKAGMYNLGYLTDGNIPEGFYSLPDNWQPQMIKDFQEYFDALMAGDDTMTSKLKFMPPGTYSPTKKRDEMAFDQFNDWLMKVTCAIFETTPIEIGFNPKTGLGGVGYNEQQGEIAENKGTRPLAMLIKAFFTKVIQEEFGFEHLCFDFPGLQQKDEKATAEKNEILIRSGQRTVNELRTDDGLAPIDGLNKPFFAGQVVYLDQESQDASAAASQAALEAKQTAAENPVPVIGEKDPKADDETTDETKFENVLNLRKNQIKELQTFRKYAVNRRKSNKVIRPFVSSVLSLDMVEELNKAVLMADELPELRKVFGEPIKEIEMLNVDDAMHLKEGLYAIA